MLTNPKKHITLIAVSTVLAGFSLACILNFTDPRNSSFLTFAFFYASLFLFCLGAFTLIGLLLRQSFWPGVYLMNLGSSFRQALLLSLLITASFVLLSWRLLFWWVELSLILFFACIEGFLNLKI